jgi:hypothetical protein
MNTANGQAEFGIERDNDFSKQVKQQSQLRDTHYYLNFNNFGTACI